MTNRNVSESIEIWPIEKLIPNARNARTHSAAQIAELAGSMRAFGFMVPILVGADGGIISGRARALSAKELGLDRVPVIVVPHLSETEREAYSIADNAIALHAGWDNELLRVQLERLTSEGVDLALVGFPKNEFDALMDELESAIRRADEDAVPAPAPDCVSRLGDVWELGGHRLVCADATDLASYQELLSGELAAMVFTDPPYSVAYKAPKSADGSVRHAAIANDDLGSDFPAFLETACRNLLLHTRGALYICMSSSELHTLRPVFAKAGGHWSTFIIWAKSTFTLGRADFQNQFEPIAYGYREGEPHYYCGARDQGNVWHFDKPHANDLHPTMKPVALVEKALLSSSRRGELVLDPFAGSGTTLIACEKTGRKARLMEIEPAYCDVIIRRWQEFTNKQALHKSTGTSFDEVQKQRFASIKADEPEPNPEEVAS
jgi:DNA modification methylase